jgi:hypothetical protein
MNAYLPGRKPSGVQALTPSSLAIRQGFPPLGAAQTPDGPHVGTQIEAIKEGDKVVRLLVTCTCGERIEIECLYGAGS